MEMPPDHKQMQASEVPIQGGQVDAQVLEAGKRKSRKPCKKGQVRGPKSKGSRCHKRRRTVHKKSHRKSKRSLRGGEAAPVESVLTAGALEEAFQAGLEAGRMHRRHRSHRIHGGEEVPVVEGGNWGMG